MKDKINKKHTIKIILVLVVGITFLLTGITLIVINQNKLNFSLSVQHNITFIHEKLALDYILIIIGTLSLSIPILFKTLNSGYIQTKKEIKSETIWKRKKQKVSEEEQA
ncbi:MULTISPECIES: hypothetical protein [unclassified Spiroplasma]|uniref:hypothetical protein n=1 Tax=unclassified Spiroplasma TaxID=2637901 RepID=UPI0027DF085C|nr:hypothetical protein [Spiroplasma sp. AdecLV25b]